MAVHPDRFALDVSCCHFALLRPLPVQIAAACTSCQAGKWSMRTAMFVFAGRHKDSVCVTRPLRCIPQTRTCQD